MSIESVMPANHLILCHPLLLLPSSNTLAIWQNLSRELRFNPRVVLSACISQQIKPSHISPNIPFVVSIHIILSGPLTHFFFHKSIMQFIRLTLSRLSQPFSLNLRSGYCERIWGVLVTFPLISSNILAPNNLGSSSSSVLSFCLFILFMGFSRQEY